jgi:transcriptional regulator with XRE-family HTH domain
MFDNISRTLTLLRDMRGKSQVDLAKAARIGKSQLSKYETGKELPKLESLEKVLKALEIGYPEFFYALRLVDGMSAGVESQAPEDRASSDPPLPPPPPSEGAYLLPKATREAFSQIFSDLLLLHHRMVEEAMSSRPMPQAPAPKEVSRRRRRRSSHRAAASSPPRSASPR